MHRRLRPLLILCSAVIVGSIYLWTQHNRWDDYFQRKLNDGPRAFVIEGLKHIPAPRSGQIALDLGAGVGHETLLLLKKGYDVIAIDQEQKAFDYLLARKDIQAYRSRLRTQVALFETLHVETLPAVDMVVASFSLPFCKPHYFHSLWQRVVNKMKPGAYFIGNFFDPQFTAFAAKDRQDMTFHTKDQVTALFAAFHMIKMEEIKTPAAESGKFDHYYTVVAQKI